MQEVSGSTPGVATFLLISFTFLLSSKFSHFVIFYSLEDNIDNQDHGKNATKPACKYGPFVPFVKKKSGATQDVESDNDMYIAFTLLSSLC